MKITIDIPDPKCGKFCSRRCMFMQLGVIADWCTLYGSIKRVYANEKRYFISYIHEDCRKAQVYENSIDT